MPLPQQVVCRQPPAREPQQQALVHPARTLPRQAVRRQLLDRGRQQPPCAPCTAPATTSYAAPVACPGAPATAPGVHWMAFATASCVSPAACPEMPATTPSAHCTSPTAAGCAMPATYLLQGSQRPLLAHLGDKTPRSSLGQQSSPAQTALETARPKSLLRRDRTCLKRCIYS